MSTVSGTGECYKKREISNESREVVVTQLTQDEFGWRKYGQKMILNYDYRGCTLCTDVLDAHETYRMMHACREYYRCTYKSERNCQATKQVQQISQNPIKYKIIYNGNHTCNNTNYILNPYPYINNMDYPPERQSSPFAVLSFDPSIPVHPLLFRPSVSSDSYNIFYPKDMAGMITGVNPVSEQSVEQTVAEPENEYRASPFAVLSFDPSIPVSPVVSSDSYNVSYPKDVTGIITGVNPVFEQSAEQTVTEPEDDDRDFTKHVLEFITEIECITEVLFSSSDSDSDSDLEFEEGEVVSGVVAEDYSASDNLVEDYGDIITDLSELLLPNFWTS